MLAAINGGNRKTWHILLPIFRLGSNILLCCDSAAWHTSGGLNLPYNIVLFYIPPYTPEMNPIEQIWKEIRKRGFHNEVFASLEKVVERLCDTICPLSNQVISSISVRDWIIKPFN
ncbi:MAG: transposase [Oscillospiraceae bacterium]|nr:transposase [Oscillospiraceae bacterium]